MCLVNSLYIIRILIQMVVLPEWKQAFYSIGAQINLMSLGMVLAHTAILLPALSDPGSQIKADLQTASWIAAIPGISGVIAIAVLAPMMHYGGRKFANICLTVPILLGWVLSFVAGQLNSISLLLISRLFQGLPTGSSYFISVCIAELSSPKMRPMLLCFKPICAVLGVCVIHFMAYYLDWKQLALVGAIPPGLGLLVTIFWPESPEWLISRGRYEEAQVVFNHLRGRSTEGEGELQQMIEFEKKRQRINKNQKFYVWRNMKSSVLWRPVAVLFFTVLIPTVGGRQFIPAYSIQLAVELSGEKSMGYFYTVLGDVLAVIAAFISLYLVKILRRRQFLLVSSFVGMILLKACSFMLYMRTIYPSKVLSWLILTVFGVYYFMAHASIIPVSYILMGEIFPLEYRAIGSVVDGFLSAVGIATVMGAMPIMERTIGIHGVFLVYGFSMLLCIVYLYFELPETKNRSLHDVGDYFRGNSPKIRKADETVNVEENRSILEQ